MTWKDEPTVTTGVLFSTINNKQGYLTKPITMREVPLVPKAMYDCM